MYSDSTMLRALAPCIAVASLAMIAGAVIHGTGGPAWVFYAAIVVAAVALAPGIDRWDQRHHH